MAVIISLRGFIGLVSSRNSNLADGEAAEPKKGEGDDMNEIYTHLCAFDCCWLPEHILKEI